MSLCKGQFRSKARLTPIVSIQTTADATHTFQLSSQYMPAAQAGHRALPTAAARALNLMISEYSRIQVDNESRYTPPLHHARLRQQPRPASPRTRDALLRDFLHHSFTPFSFFYSSPRPVLPAVKARCQPLCRSRALCPHPLCKWFTTTPTRTFFLYPPSFVYSLFLYLFLVPLATPCNSSDQPFSLSWTSWFSLIHLSLTKFHVLSLFLPSSMHALVFPAFLPFFNSSLWHCLSLYL